MKIKRTVDVETNDFEIGDRLIINDAEWKILDIIDNEVLIWKCTNVGMCCFNRDKNNVYNGSDIQKYLQNDFLKEFPEDMLKNVSNEGFFLLTVDQINKYMPIPSDRTVTNLKMYNIGWWTSTPYVCDSRYVSSVHTTGHVSADPVRFHGGVAPACWLKIQQ